MNRISSQVICCRGSVKRLSFYNIGNPVTRDMARRRVNRRLTHKAADIVPSGADRKSSRGPRKTQEARVAHCGL